MLIPSITKNDKKASIVIWTVSVLVFCAVALLSEYKLSVRLPFNVHVFAEANAIINSAVAFLLLCGLLSVKQKNYHLHRAIMLTAIVLSILFLISYVCHHLLAEKTIYGDINHDGILSKAEKAQAHYRGFYYFVLATHIPLAAIVLPVILFTAYRALIGEYEKHKKLVRVTWPLWFYVAVTGVIVYLMIRPYYL